MRFLIVADFSLQQRGKYTESFLIIKGFEKKMRLSQDFFYGCNDTVSRRQELCFGAGDTRAATGESVCIHHPRLRYAHLGLIRFDLFEVVNDGATIPLQRFCHSTRSPRSSIYPRRLCAGNADMQCGRDESRPYNMFLKKHALYSYRNCEDAVAYFAH